MTEGINQSNRFRTGFLLSFIFTIGMIGIMRWQGNSLVTPISPKGIIDVEFAKTPERFRELRLFLNQDKLLLNLQFDFLFIIAYTWFLIAACQYIQLKRSWKGDKIFRLFATAGGFFDVVENLLLIQLVKGTNDAFRVKLVFYCAAIKVVLLGIVVLYLLLSWLLLMGKRKVG